MEKSRICLALTESTIEANVNLIWKYRDSIDMAELRADFLDPYQLAYIFKFPSLVDLPVILTFRRKFDGGKFDGSESERLNLINQALIGRFAFIDLENDTRDVVLERKIREKGMRIIRSLHDFKGVPENLDSRLRDLAARSDELPKVAVMPRSTADLVKIIKCAQEVPLKDKILIGMGDYGFATRILSTKLGSYLTFCSAPGGQKAAPGHIDPDMLDEIYRFRNIGRETKVYGIIGNPIMHTASPAIHNTGYRLLDIDAVYVPFLVDKLPDFLPLISLLDIRGFSVTIPHKEAIIQHLSGKEPGLDDIGACNTVEKSGRGLKGSNTDAPGFIAPLEQCLAEALTGLKATVIGAGGSARAVVYALVKKGVEVLILNRTVERAQQLADLFGCRCASLDRDGTRLMESYSDIIVQTTSVGMEPDINGDPVKEYDFKGHEIAYDLVYKPAMTCFLQRAEEAGCRIIQGREMLLHQAYAQFYRFTGREYPDTEE